MKTEEVVRWEFVVSRQGMFLRDRHKHEGILIEIHESHVITSDEHFITIYCSSYDVNFAKYCSLTQYDYEAEMYVYIFKRRGEDECYTRYL